MKKVVISLVTLSSIVLLAACGQSNTASTSSSSSSKAKTSQTSASSSSKAKSESSKASSQATASEASSAAADSSETSTASSEQAKEVATPAENQAAAKNVADVASFAGTWANDRGETVTINADGSVVSTNAAGDSFDNVLRFQDASEGVGTYAIYNPNALVGGAVFTYIPSGVTNPRLGTTDTQDTLVIGQDISADYHPYYRQ